MKAFLNENITSHLLGTINSIAKSKEDTMEEISADDINDMWKYGSIGTAEELMDWDYTIIDDNLYLKSYKNTSTAENVDVHGSYMLNGRVYKTFVGQGALFFNNSYLKSINFVGNIKFVPLTESITGDRMFHQCFNVESIDMSRFDISEMTSAYSMFSQCYKLKYLKTGGMNVSEVVNSLNMFYACNQLESVDLMLFGTSKMTNMNQTFLNCYKLKEILVSRDKWIIPEGCTTTDMFLRCGVDHVTYMD